jgi:hypothetical protein
MLRPGHWQLRSAVGALAGTVALGALAAAAPAMAAQASAAARVSTKPASGTPELAPTGHTEQIRQLVQCGGTMYAVGTFTSISQGGSTFSRNNAFSFSATKPYTVTSWNPDVNGIVNTIAFASGNCSDAYIGGHFSQVHGTSAKNLAKISTSTGAVDTSFGHNSSAQVQTMLAAGSHLLTGGDFTSINGTKRGYYASLNLNTGKDDGYLSLNISGHYSYPKVKPNPTRVYNQQLSPAGTKVLVEGDFTSVGGQHRQQIFMIQLGSGSATLTGWNAPIFNDNCSISRPFYVQAAAWGSNNRIYTADAGLHLAGWNHTFPLTGPCDAALALPATNGSVQPIWTNYTGCDSLYSTAADSGTVYVGGHERWADNANGCNHAGKGAIKSMGMSAFSASGSLVLNSSKTAGRYSRSRGLGADDMLLTSAGLWIASDNQKNVDRCMGVAGHAGICFLPSS